MDTTDHGFENYNTPSEENRKLYEKVVNFEDQFDDMLMKNGSILEKLLQIKHLDKESGEWKDEIMCPPSWIDLFDIDWYRFEVKPLASEYIMGDFNKETQILTVSPAYFEDDRVILHEMIHLHEHIYEELPLYFHDMLFFCLYLDLQKKIPDLNEIMTKEAHLLNESRIYEDGGLHDLLFLLKSFDLDIRNDYPLGTVFGYGKLDEFKDYKYTK